MIVEVIAADEEACVRGVQRWMALDLWMANGGDSFEFEEHIERHGWATTWSYLLSLVRSKG